MHDMVNILLNALMCLPNWFWRSNQWHW